MSQQIDVQRPRLSDRTMFGSKLSSMYNYFELSLYSHVHVQRGPRRKHG